jgi:hypothetical protein
MMREDFKKAARGVFGLTLITAVAILGLAGCGGGSTPVTSALDLKSPGARPNGVLDSSVFCGWGSLWVPLEWGEVPEDTKELAILLARFKHVNEGGKPKLVVAFADLVSKFKPSEHKLVANVLPEGVTWSWFGTNCLPRRGQNILLEVFALDKVRKREVDKRLATRLTEEALKQPHPREGPRSAGELTSDTAAIGRLIVTYGPPQ